MRLFITLEAPEEWRVAEAAQQIALLDSVGEDAQDALRIVSAELMHITLRFLGEVDEGAVDPLQAALDAVAVPEVALTLARAGTFGAPSPTWAIYQGIAGDLEVLAGLVTRVEDAVQLAGLPPLSRAEQARPFTPHLTIARVQRSAPNALRREIDDAVAHLDAPPPTPHLAREIALVRSYLDGPKPRYEVLSRHG